MTRPICEEMTTRPAQPGWQQWGVVSADGQTFEPLYGLETALPRESALYYLAAAGICDIQGQPRAGAMMPVVEPAPIVDQLPAPTPVATEQPVPVADLVPAPQGTPTWMWGVGLVLLLIVGGSAATRARRKQTDTTPKPQGFTFNKGDSDAIR
jgi:hypothetical protein